MKTQYLVRKLSVKPNEIDCFTFETAAALAIFMWGRDNREWMIYISLFLPQREVTSLEVELIRITNRVEELYCQQPT